MKTKTEGFDKSKMIKIISTFLQFEVETSVTMFLSGSFQLYATPNDNFNVTIQRWDF